MAHQHESGFIEERVFGPTNSCVVIYLAAEQSIDVGGDKYAIVCSLHGNITSDNTRAGARVSMAAPTNFCEDCREVVANQKFVAVGMRTKLPDQPDKRILVVNTCSGNDGKELGDQTHWDWANPTSRHFPVVHPHDPECRAVSVEALWQGCKLMKGQEFPYLRTLDGDWRAGKGRRPVGAWDGPGRPLLVTPGSARRAIYLPTYARQLELWQEHDQVRIILETARFAYDIVYLRDFDTGQGVDRNGPMSHAWALATYLNTGSMPQ